MMATLRSWTCGHEDSTECDRTAPALPAIHPRPRPHRPRYFLELFSDTARLTKAVQSVGGRVLPDFEVSKQKCFDLLCPATQEFILKLILNRRVWYIHLGTPCTVWSRARHNLNKNLFKARRKEAIGVSLALFSACVIRQCLISGIMFTLENPQSSRWWEFGPIRDLFMDKRVCFFTFHMFAWGMPYKKATSFMTNVLELACLQKRCSGDHRHEHLRGSETVLVKRTRNKTAAAGAYPSSLCKAWAQKMISLGPLGSRGQTSPEEILDFMHGVEAAADGPHRSSPTSTSGHLQQTDGDQDVERFLKHARNYIRTHPVIFGHFTAHDIARLSGYKGSGGRSEEAGAHAHLA